MALAEVWKSAEIEDLRTRIADRERIMVMQLCSVSRYVHLCILIAKAMVRWQY